MNDIFQIEGTSNSGDDFDVLVRQQLHQLADQAPTTVRQIDDIAVGPGHAGRPRSGRRVAGIGATIAALVGAVGITTVALNGAGSGGASTPDEAVRVFVQAAQQQDVLGMIDVVDPTEVPALRDAFESASSEAKRVQLLGEDFTLDGVDGLDVVVDELTLSTEQLSTGVAVVTATGGIVTTAFDPSAFPYGPVLGELIDVDVPSTSVTDLGQRDNVFLATVQRDGRWFVSIGYTVAEYARRAADVDLPSATLAIGPGFDSPDAAVTAFYRALAAFDFAGMVATAAPGEGDAVIEYAPLWLPASADVTTAIHDDGYRFQFDDIGFTSSGDGDRQTLQATTFDLTGLVPPSDAAVSSDSETLRIQRSDGCTTWSGQGARRFIDPIQPSMGLAGDFTAVGDDAWRSCRAAPLGVSAVFSIGAGGLTELPDVATVRVDGRWYVSPLGTVATSFVDLLRDIPDGESLFDSAIAPFVYGTSRPVLEMMYVGKSDGQLPAGCEALFVFDASGTITAVVDQPSTAVLRQCRSSDISIGQSSAPPQPAEVATTAPLPATTPTTVSG